MNIVFQVVLMANEVIVMSPIFNRPVVAGAVLKIILPFINSLRQGLRYSGDITAKVLTKFCTKYGNQFFSSD